MIISWRGTDISISEVSIQREPVFDENNKLLFTRITIIGYDYNDTATIDTESAPDNLPDTDSGS